MSTDPNSDLWDPEQIQRLVIESGRPLEVKCGTAFLEQGWGVSHGTYFIDVIDGRAREVDIIAGKKRTIDVGETLLTRKSISCRMGVFISCKGFRPDQAPVAYTLGNDSFPDFMPPSLMCTGLPDLLQVAAHHQAQLARDVIFGKGGLDHSRRIVVLDLIEKRYPNRKKNKETKDRGTKAPPIVEVVDYVQPADRDLYEGLDSAVKAAMYWDKITFLDGIHLRIPVLLTSKPWFEVPIDKGIVGKPVPGTRGFKSILHPSGNEKKGSPDWITSLVWAESELPALVSLLNIVFDNFVDEVQDDFEKGKLGG